MNTSTFDIKSYLESREITYHVEGEKNVSRGWVNINCPFPDCHDGSWHCGINLKSKLFNCYICGRKGSPILLIKEIENCSWSRAKNILRKFIDTSELNLEREVEHNNRKCELPKTDKVFHKLHYKYLKERFKKAKINPNYLIERYNLQTVYNIGYYKFRIIIPYYYRGRLVSFNSRDITGKAEIPYLFSKEENSIIEVKHTLYGIDNIDNKCFIVEGPFDKWAMGSKAVAVSGKMFTKEQILMLVRKKIKKAVVLFDADDVGDKSSGVRLANQLSGIISKVKLIELEDGDPADLTREEINEIRREL